MLRESSQISEVEIDLSEVTGGLSGGTRINEAEALVGLVESVVQRNEQAVETARDQRILPDQGGRLRGSPDGYSPL